MTNDMDAKVKAALEQEEREILARFGDEPGPLRQTFGAFGLFRGPLAWTIWFAVVMQFFGVTGFIFAMVQMYQSAELVEVVRWGIVTVMLFSFALFVKSATETAWQVNRLLREIYL